MRRTCCHICCIFCIWASHDTSGDAVQMWREIAEQIHDLQLVDCLDWKQIYALLKRLVSLDIIEAQLRAPPKTIQYYSFVLVQRVSGRELICVPMIPKDASLSDSYSSDRCCFSCLANCFPAGDNLSFIS